jgi:hypothetical protein
MMKLTEENKALAAEMANSVKKKKAATVKATSAVDQEKKKKKEVLAVKVRRLSSFAGGGISQETRDQNKHSRVAQVPASG